MKKENLVVCCYVRCVYVKIFFLYCLSFIFFFFEFEFLKFNYCGLKKYMLILIFLKERKLNFLLFIFIVEELCLF